MSEIVSVFDPVQGKFVRYNMGNYQTQEPQTIEDKPSKIRKVGKSLAKGVKEGGKLAAANKFAKYLQEVFSKILIENFGMKEEDVNHPMVQKILLGFSPAFVLFLTEMFEDQIPHGDKIKAAAEVTMTAVSAEIIGEMIAPLTKELLNIVKKSEGVINPSFEKALPESQDSELEVEMKKKASKKGAKKKEA